MIDKKEKKRIFENSRIISYFVILFSGVLQCTLPFTYFCDSGEYSCLLCGMRHAIDYILQFDFYNAYKSNPLIIVIIAIGLLMIVDTVIIVFNRIKKH